MISHTIRTGRLKMIAAIVGVILLLVTAVGIASALPTLATIDGLPGDWDGTTHPPAAVCVPDALVDDESSPTRADITDYCLHIDPGYLYTLMGWDDTGFTGGTASTAGVRLDVDGDGFYDFIVLGRLNGTPAQLVSFSIGTCPGGDCGNTQEICSGTATSPGTCTRTVGPTTYSAAAAAGTTYPDRWLANGRPASSCSGTNCLIYDAFVEMAIPWQILPVPGAPAGTYYEGPPAPFTLGTYGSYPSGPAQAPKDFGGGFITCRPNMVCYESTPTAIVLASQQTNAGAPAGWLAPAGLLLVVAAASLALVTARRRRPA